MHSLSLSVNWELDLHLPEGEISLTHSPQAGNPTPLSLLQQGWGGGINLTLPQPPLHTQTEIDPEITINLEGQCDEEKTKPQFDTLHDSFYTNGFDFTEIFDRSSSTL